MAATQEKIREQTERVVDVSLADPHPRVRWAAIQVILSSISDHEKEHVQYLMKFLPRLVTIIRSSASIYPRVQFLATRAVHHLINYCDHEDDVRLFSEDLVPELLKFLKIFRDGAMEVLRSLAVSFPVVFRGHYQETVDSLKPLVSRSLLGVKSIESLSYIFSRTTLTIDKEQIPSCPEQRILACDLLSNFAVRFQEKFAPWASRVSPLLTSLFRSTDDDDDNCHFTADVKISSIKALPSVLLSCLHRKETQGLINSTVQALVNASQNEMKRAIDIEMLKSLNACIAISGSVFNVDVIKQIAVLIHHQLSQGSLFANQEHVTDYEMEQEEEIIQAAKCLETMINTLKSAFLPHVDKLLPSIEALYRDTYPRVVMDFCESESPQLQREAACGIGLCATHRELISNFDALEAINNLYHVIERAMESDRRMTYDAAVSALGKICEFRHDTINGPEVVPIWLNFLPLRNDCEEAKYAHQQLCRLLEKADPDLLGLNNENLYKSTQILREILLQSDYIATEETTCSIIYLLTQLGAMP
ncbi:hypothetical protein K1719_029489 [Acacia pycnantha]|nr:hypothetical protein K1719_029489 [Acacia pycnantha]